MAIYVAAQVADSREWIPVAKLSEGPQGYSLSYTRGAQRFPGFAGLGRMTALDKVYHSPTLFPFFANRLVPKSRPEYRQYIQWLGMEGQPVEPMSVLGVTGGLNTTGAFELIATPRRTKDGIELDFFPRGLRYLDPLNFQLICAQEPGSRLFLAHDFQNARDPHALLLRTEKPMGVAGYIPRYYCAGVHHLLNISPETVRVEIKRINNDAPLDMRLLCTLTAHTEQGFDLFADEPNFGSWESEELATRSENALQRAILDLPS